MVRSPAKSKESKWSHLRTRPRVYKPTHRPFNVLWEDSSPNVLGKSQRSPCDAVPPSYSTPSGSEEAVIQHTSKVMRSGYESELDEDPIPPSVRKLILVPSSRKALSAEPLSNLPPSKPSELLKDLCLDSEHSLISECSREALLVKRPLLNITSEPQAPGSKHSPMKEMSRSFGKEQSRKLDFEAGTNGASVPTSQRQHRTVSMNWSVNAHGTEKMSASKESKNRHSRIDHVEDSKSSPPGNEQVALAKKRMPDVTDMPHSCTTPVAQNIQTKERTQYTCESESTKCSSFGNRQGVPAKKCISNASPFVPRAHSTPIPSMKHISIGSSSIPMELRSGLARWRTAPQLETSPVSLATKNPQMSCIFQSTAAESKQHSRASSHSFTKMTQVKTCQDIITAGTDKNGEPSPGKACEIALVEQHDVPFPAHQKADGAKQSSLSKHNRSQAPAEDKQASKRSPKQLHVSFGDQRKYLEHTFINREVQSEEGSPVIPKLQERGLTRKDKRDAQWGTESPVIPKLQEGAQAKKPKMDTHDLQLSPAVATVQERAHRKKRKRPKVWVQVQLYDQPTGLRTKADVTMYDIYLSLALEIIEENRQQCQSEKERKVMARFYEEVAKDATKIIDELQVYTNELSELEQEMSKMRDLTKKLDRISHGLGKYVKENNIKNVDPYQFYFEDEEEDDV